MSGDKEYRCYRIHSRKSLNREQYNNKLWGKEEIDVVSRGVITSYNFKCPDSISNNET